MDAMYRLDIGSQIDSRGVSTFMQKGEAVTVEGAPMVRLSHGVIVRAHGWCQDKVQAQLAAAAQIEEMGRSLLAQAEQLRAAATPQGVTT